VRVKYPRTLALILAGGKGSRLGVLTERRAKPALPFAGTYHLIDIPLSNLLHSGLSHVWVVQQYLPNSLNNHLANGRPWDLDRTHGGLRVLPPYQGAEGEGFAEGNADALYRQRKLIREFAPDLVLVLSADHLYTLDYRDVLERHLSEDAALTMVTTKVKSETSRFGVVETDGDRVTGFAYKPEKPKTDTVTAEVFLYTTEALLETLETLAEGGEALSDYGDTLLPQLVERETVLAHPLPGYWRDVGTVQSYWEGHMDLLAGKSLDFDDPAWPILSSSPQRLPARIEKGAALDNSLVSPGARVAGRVVNSVVGNGAVVEAGASVVDSVLLEGVHVGPEASLIRTVADLGARFGKGAQVGGEGGVTLVGMNARVRGGRSLEAGEEVPPTA
jgi:glucose-1-phosphate adenylyltransferase